MFNNLEAEVVIMIKLMDSSRTVISMLTNVKDYHIVETLDGNETLYFSLPIEDAQNTNIKLEYYVQNEKNRYVIKEKHSAGDWYDYVCQLDLDDFRNIYKNTIGTYTLSTLVYYACIGTGTGWTHSTVETTAKYVEGDYQSNLDELKSFIAYFGCEAKFDTINKIINVVNQLGEDKGCYFIEELNLKKLDIDSDTNNLITRLEPIGKDGLSISSVNSGLNYVSNNTYTSKIIYGVWQDERYTNASQLKTDATAKLAELCKPATTYSVDVVDLASASMEYADILSYELGDTVTLFNRKENQKQTHRIIEIDKYPEEPHRNKCQLSSRAYSIIGVQKQAFKSTDSLQGKVGITKANGDGTVSTAKAGTDYQTPITAGTDYVAPSYFTNQQVSLTLLNGVTSQGWYNVVYKSGNVGLVLLAIKATSNVSNGTTIANLPAGYSAYSISQAHPTGNTSNNGAIGVNGSVVRVVGLLSAGTYQVAIPYIIA